jgi:predicted HicB family RNase H-like nuclease
LSWLAKTQGEALNGITRAVRDVVADMQKSGEEIPQPLSLQQFSGKLLVRIPPEQHRELATEAAEQGVPMNRLISRKLAR